VVEFKGGVKYMEVQRKREWESQGRGYHVFGSQGKPGRNQPKTQW